jgi:preprotein translocase subunit SecD
VACYQVAPRRFLDAGGVATAEARESRATGTWEVGFTLTPEGVGRFGALFDDVGPGGQFAVLVDGQIVSAPAFDGGPRGDTGVLTGLDERTARSLANRLRR